MTDRVFEQIKLLLDSIPRGEYGLHDTISARRAIIETENIGEFVSLYDLAKSITSDSLHDEAVERLNSLSNKHKRIVIWCLTNLYTREVCILLRRKQHATKLLRFLERSNYELSQQYNIH